MTENLLIDVDVSDLGMNNPQYIQNPIINDKSLSTPSSYINPGFPGVDFTTTNGSVVIPLAPNASPIIVEVSIPNANTNVDEITVIVKGPDGEALFTGVSPSDTNSVAFPNTPFPEGSEIIVTFSTNDNQSPVNVTLSIFACYIPTTRGTAPSSRTSGVTGKRFC